MDKLKPALYANQFADSDKNTGERTKSGNGIYLGCDDKSVTEQAFIDDGEMLNEISVFYAEKDVLELLKQRAELLEALKGMCELYDTDEGTRSLPQYVAAISSITKVEAAE